VPHVVDALQPGTARAWPVFGLLIRTRDSRQETTSLAASGCFTASYLAQAGCQ